MDIFKVPVFKLGAGPDKNGYNHPMNSEIEFNNTVPLVKNFNKNLSKAIGTASLRMLDGTVYADLYFINDEDYSEVLFPSIGGRILSSITDISTGEKTVSNMSIDMVSVGIESNVDSRIKKLGDL